MEEPIILDSSDMLDPKIDLYKQNYERLLRQVNH